MDSKKLWVLMVGVDHNTKGGMWSVARGYLESDEYLESVDLTYLPVATVGSFLRKIVFFLQGFIKILIRLSVGRYNVVHIHVSERGSVYRKIIIAKLAKVFRCKVIFHMHGAEFEPWYNGLTDGKKRFVKNCLNKSDGILILGEYWRSFISSLMDDKQKVKVLYNAVQVSENNRYDTDARNLLFLGEVGKRKGAYDLLEAMSLVEDQIGDGQLFIYGSNPDGDIVQRIEDQKLQHCVRYMGWADPSQFEQLFAGIAVNILPSYNEGLPMTILETMAYGIPSITTDIAAIPEVVNQENGVLLQPGDIKGLAAAIVELIQNRDMRAVKSECAFHTIKDNFSTQRHMSEVLKIYGEIVK